MNGRAGEVFADASRVEGAQLRVAIGICSAEKRTVDAPRHLIVDGYNILHAWQWLRGRGAGSGPGLDEGRSRLIEAVRPIRDVEHLAVTVVFDGRGAAIGSDAAASEPGISVLFAPAGKTADDIIEAMVAGSADARAWIVATADGLERETVLASGATCLSPASLREWSDRCRARATQAAARHTDRSRGGWENRLPL